MNENNELYWEQKNPEYQETALGDLISAKDILDYDLIKAVQGGQLTKKKHHETQIESGESLY